MATKKDLLLDESNTIPETTNPELEEMMEAEASPGEPLPQTESEIGENNPEGAPDPAAEGGASQTGPDSEESGQLPSEMGSEFSEEGAVLQTDTESAKNKLASLEDRPDPNAEAVPPQTEPVKKPRRRKKAEDISQSDPAPNEAENSAADGVEEAPKTRRKRAYTKPSLSVVSIDDRPSVETDADKAKNDLLDLIESQKTGRILSGTVQGIERAENNTGRATAILYHGAFKVIIPAEEAVDPPDDFRGRLPEDVFHYMLTKRLGAEVDYIVKGIDAKSGLAVASRLEAMRAKRRQYYFGTDRDGNNLLYSGICAEARVVSVIRAGIFVDLFGLEVYIPLRELSYQRMMDAAGYFQPGQRILVKILDVDRSDRNYIKVTASVKQAGENPYEQALRKYTVGSRYVGTVSMVDVNGVFVALDGGIDCLCSYPKRGRPPRGARVTVRILGINHDSNRIWGAITHIASAR